MHLLYVLYYKWGGKKFDMWEEFEDTKGVIRIRISKKNRQHNGKKKVQKDKQRSTKHTHNTKDRETRTPLKSGVNSEKMEGCETLEQVLIKNNYA